MKTKEVFKPLTWAEINNEPEPVFRLNSWKTNFWKFNLILQSILLISSVSGWIWSIIELSKQNSFENKLLIGLCFIFSILLLISSIFWLVYNSPTFKLSLKKLKTRSIFMDWLLVGFIFIVYSIGVYLLYINLNPSLKFTQTFTFSGILWFTIACGVFKFLTLIVNYLFYKKQATMTFDEELFAHNIWWKPTLIYSFLLDDLMFSMNYVTQDDAFTILNKSKIQENHTLRSRKNLMFKWLNVAKRFLQTRGIWAITFIAGMVAISFVTWIYWVHSGHFNTNIIIFLICYYLMFTFIVLYYVSFFITNQCQVISNDDESDLIKKYESIRLKFFKNKQNIVTQIDNQSLIWWLGIIRKFILYYSNLSNTSKVVQFILRLDDEYFQYTKDNKTNYIIEFDPSKYQSSNKPVLNISVYL